MMAGEPEQEMHQWPASRGVAWLAGSWALIRTQPLRLLLLSLFLQILLSFSQTSALGVLVVLCLPVLSAGMLQAFNLVDRGQKPLLATLFSPFASRHSVGRLLLLGALVILLSLLVVSLLLSGQVVDLDVSTLNRIEQGDLDAIGLLDPQLIKNAIVALVVGAAVSGTLTYFAVPLIWFGTQQTVHAVTLGLKAMAKNWRPLLVVGLLLGLIALPIAMLFGFFYLSVISAGAGSSWLAGLTMLLGPLLQLLLFGSQYVAFRDIFGDTAGHKHDADEASNQLVA